MAKIPYAKIPKTYSEQLQILKDRGLKIENDAKAIHLLNQLSYYRLSGYWYPLLQDPKKDHRFKTSASFQTAFRIYRFDRDLRILILKEIEKIEVAIRSQMIYVLSHYKGSYWYEDSSLFTNSSEHTKSLRKFKYDFNKSDEDFVQAFKNTYSEELPPSWMMLEITSFGSLSELYKNLRPGKSKRQIAHHFGLDDSTFASWIHSFTYVRNLCAHHSRFWNRAMSIKPQMPLSTTNQWLNNTAVKNNKAYYFLSMMLYLLQSIDSKHSFIFRLKILLKKYPNIDVAAMGFPSNWTGEKLWLFKPTLKQRIRLAITSQVK